MKISKLLITTAVMSVLSVGAFADDASAANSNNKIYVGVEGGLADSNFDLNKFYKNYIPANQAALANAGLTQAEYKNKNNNLYGAIHTGMLFPVADDISVGGQVGFQKFGSHSVSTSATDGVTSASSKESEKISDLNAEFIVQGVYNKFFANVDAGLGYFMVDNSGEITNFSAGLPGVTTDAPKNKNSVRPIAGLELGYMVTEHVDTYVSYNHVFGSNNHGDFSNKVPSINSIGLGIDYVF